MRTVAPASARIRVDPDLIAKTVAVVISPGITIVAMARRRDRINRRRIAAAAATSSLYPANPASVRATTGYSPGDVSPVGHRHSLAFIVNCGVALRRGVYPGGGDDDLLLEVDVTRLTSITSAVVIQITWSGSACQASLSNSSTPDPDTCRRAARPL